ncbi:tubulin glycylase 3A-like [Phymastichus coffea]|uniref:tubulin glycylase 3A-like n=1 Tax=Phymastichus coffea TaxID=108790 RepID=UPI00273CCE9C|nr:tubulin glycylase 3A-like [Phymastichus coffea]XP_058803785.1 tubulin glycylase 3A-like [Phymastichus coffea]XP_058803786.1 tubulin glycylase 3A-like [Phymastichus coffea]
MPAEEDASARRAADAQAEAPAEAQAEPRRAAPEPAPPEGQAARASQMEHLQRIRERVRRAIAAKHTFAILGRARLVREALLARDWCEKLPRRGAREPSAPGGPGAGAAAEPQLGPDASSAALLAGLGDLGEAQNERLLVSRMLGARAPDLLWSAGADAAGWPAPDDRSTLFNRFGRAGFTSKLGLCASARQLHWHYEAGVAHTRFPRCYSVSQAPEQLQAFVEDFRATACLSLLKWLLERAEGPGGLADLASAAGPVPLRALDFALGRVAELLASRRHQDLDREPERVWAHQWEQFLGWYYKLVQQRAALLAGEPALREYALAARHLLRRARPFLPQLDMDGCLCVWILKPGNKSRGRGIVLMSRLDEILAKVGAPGRAADARFVVQKYIERPLLIHDTKFDIRQWFLVTSAQPLTVWMYRESYLRFCSQKFSLRDFHESIHLSNNAVQCKYKNGADRAAALPAENMWDVASFKRWLAERGDPEAWERLIYPGMRQGLVGSLLASQEAMDRRRNSFELYGADFMLMDDYSVWLIEINSHPDMSASTSVTSRLCRRAMEDIIKVVVDYRESPGGADTGDFELVYKQRLSGVQAYLGAGLSLHGTRIQAGAVRDRERRARGAPPATPGPALVDLVEELELQLDREFCEYVRLRQTGGLARRALPGPPDGPANAPQLLDVQTNTAARPVDPSVAQCLSAQAPSVRLPTAQPHSAESGRGLGARADALGKRAQRASLISKIIDLRKHSADPRVPSRAAHYSAIDGQLLKPVEDTATAGKDEPQSAINRPAASSKLATPIAGSVAASSKHKLASKTRPKDKKAIASRKRNRTATSQVLLDVTDIYAIGLSVSK